MFHHIKSNLASSCLLSSFILQEMACADVHKSKFRSYFSGLFSTSRSRRTKQEHTRRASGSIGLDFNLQHVRDFSKYVISLSICVYFVNEASAHIFDSFDVSVWSKTYKKYYSTALAAIASSSSSDTLTRSSLFFSFSLQWACCLLESFQRCLFACVQHDKVVG